MRSSPARGVPRPSRFDVENHNVPSGADAAARNRPWQRPRILEIGPGYGGPGYPPPGNYPPMGGGYPQQ